MVVLVVVVLVVRVVRTTTVCTVDRLVVDVTVVVVYMVKRSSMVGVYSGKMHVTPGAGVAQASQHVMPPPALHLPACPAT